MYDNYPPGAANDPNAPYNQSDPEPIEVSICMTVGLSKTCTVGITNYHTEVEEEADIDDDGRPYSTAWKHDVIDASSQDFVNSYNEANYSITELLELLGKIAETHCEEYKNGTTFDDRRNFLYWKRVLESTQGWTVDEEDACQE